MSFALAFIVSSALLPAADADQPAPLRYLRPATGKYVLASEVTTTRSDDGTIVTHKSEGPGEQITLTVHFDRDGKVTRAEAVQDGPRKVATLSLGEKGMGTLKRGGLTDFLKDLPAKPVVTAGPDWTAALLLVPLYDGTKGGKQEMPGLWIDPVQGLQTPTFTVERQGDDAVTLKDKAVKLDRYRIKLRGGEAAVWADGDGRVVRVQPLAAKAVPVVLEGFEDATKGLKP